MSDEIQNSNYNPAHVAPPRYLSNFVHAQFVIGSNLYAKMIGQAVAEQRAMSAIVEDALRAYLQKREK